MTRGPRAAGDCVVVITGASSGIGRGAARAFAGRGADVVLAARSEQSLAEVAAECRQAGGRTLVVPTDVTDEAAVDRLAHRAAARFGRIDVWLNNAAVIAYGRFEETPGDVYRRIIETNLFGQVHGARAVLPHFRRQGAGVLINMASLYAKMTSPYVGAYITSKFGVLGFSEVLRQELHDAPDIHVCTVLPASVDTPIFRKAANYTGRAGRPVPPVSDPRRVVRVILACVERPRPEVTVGQVGHALAWAHALLPPLYNRLVPWVVDRAALTSEHMDATPGNVFRPLPRWNGVTGEWRRRRPVLLAGTAAIAAVASAPLAARRLRRGPRGGSGARGGRKPALIHQI